MEVLDMTWLVIMCLLQLIVSNQLHFFAWIYVELQGIELSYILCDAYNFLIKR